MYKPPVSPFGEGGVRASPEGTIVITVSFRHL